MAQAGPARRLAATLVACAAPASLWILGTCWSAPCCLASWRKPR